MKATTSSSLLLKDRKQLNMTKFAGVDLSSSPLHVATYRATAMTNLVNKYGVNHKRNGWEQKYKVTGKVHAIIDCDGYILVHSGTKLYKIVDSATQIYVTDVSNGFTLTDTDSQHITYKGIVYMIGCGGYYMWDGTTLSLVSSNAYVPTTTVSIQPKDSTSDTRTSLDGVNMLTSRRKNTCLGRNSSATFKLDSAIDNNTSVSVYIERSNGTVVYTNSGSDKTKLYDSSGNVTSSTINFVSGEIYIAYATPPVISGRDNITIEFSATAMMDSETKYEDVINGCQFFAMFGVDGNTDAFFFSGNKRFKNMEWHSAQEDPSYIEDTSLAEIGLNAINGYARMSDSTLAVLKEPSVSEPTIFYKTGQYQTIYDDNGNIDTMRAIYPNKAGSIGEGNINSRCIGNLAGDVLMLSKNGVNGIVLTDNIATNERYARERSRNINEDLKKHDLSKAHACVWDDKYILCVDGIAYVADPRFKYTSSTDIDGSYNYEWWYWDNIPAMCLEVIDDELWFGTNDGRICKFGNTYKDTLKDSTSAGELSIDVTDNHIDYSHNTLTLKEDDNIVFKSSNVYLLLASNTQIENGKIKVSSLNGIYDGRIVKADNVGNSGLALNTEYEIFNVDRGENTFQLANAFGATVSISSGGFRLLAYCSGQNLFVTDVNETQGTFCVKENKSNYKIPIANYNGTVVTYPVADIIHYENVVAKWYSPILDMGSNAYAKTMLSLTISTEPEVNGNIKFGYQTRQIDEIMSARGVGIFTFDDISFNDFTFSTGFATSFTVPLNVRNFNFIIFRFVSDNDKDCAVSSITAKYKINTSTRGVM